MMQQQPQGQQSLPRRDSSAMSMGGGGGMGGMGALGGLGGMGGMGGMGGAGGPVNGDGADAVEIDPEQVRAIRRMVAENPTLMAPLIESLKETDPEGAAHLAPDDPDGILRYFEELANEDVPSGSTGSSSSNGPIALLPAPEPRHATLPPTAQSVSLTPAEQASIQKVGCPSRFHSYHPEF
jgi:hypothetical protein